MSDDDSTGVFKKHRGKIWGAIGLVTLISIIGGLVFFDMVPGLGFLASPVSLAFYGISAFVAVTSYGAYKFKQGDILSGGAIGGSTSVDKQLTKSEAKELAQWDLFNRDDPIRVGDEIRCNVKPVTNREEGTSTRVFEWEFEGLRERETYCYQMSLDQEIHFEFEWIEYMTPENIEKLESAVRSINNPSLERKSYADDWSERLKQNREEIGQVVRDSNVTEYLDDEGNVKKREKKQVTVNQNPALPDEVNKE